MTPPDGLSMPPIFVNVLLRLPYAYRGYYHSYIPMQPLLGAFVSNMLNNARPQQEEKCLAPRQLSMSTITGPERDN